MKIGFRFRNNHMPSLPIPVFGALVLGFLFLRMWFVERRLTPLGGLLALCAVQALIIALAQHYLIAGFRLVQPITATLLPPAAWLAFQVSAVRAPRARDLWHLIGPVLALVCLLLLPQLLDALIPALFVGYGILILVVSLNGADAQPRLSMAHGDVPTRLWQIIALALIASAFSDLLIIAARLAGAEHLQPWIISLYSVGNLMLIGGLSLSGALQSHFDSAAPEEEATADADAAQDEDFSAQDGPVLAQLDQLMQSKRLYLDPDLSLTKLSRKLGIPAKTLSSAVNRATGQNVSRYVNNRRIDAAQSALKSGESVTNAMLASGFNTKSNFNREFLRVTGHSPRDWLATLG